MEYSESGVKFYLPNNYVTDIKFKLSNRINDGNWHLVTFNCNLKTGTVILYLDTIKHATMVDPALAMASTQPYSFKLVSIL